MSYAAKIRNIPYINRNRAEKVAMFNEKPSFNLYIIFAINGNHRYLAQHVEHSQCL